MNIHTLTPSQRLWMEAHKARRAEWERKAHQPALAPPANQNKRVRVIMRLPTPDQYPALTIDPADITRRQYARKRSIELGFTLDQIRTGGRQHDLVKAKHLIIWEIKTRWPHSSWHEIADVVGLKDHSTCFYVFQKIQAMKDEGKL